MEPLSAFGLAVNIIQVVDFSATLLREAYELHQSSTGQTAEHAELKQIAESLSQMCHALSVPSHRQRGLGVAGAEILTVAASAKAVAEDLIAVIERLRVKDGGSRHWRTFRQALATLWKKSKIERYEKRLVAMRGQLQAHLVAEVAYVHSLATFLISPGSNHFAN
jgi:hypothetical protein